MKCDELKDYDIMDIEAMDDERLEKSKSGKIQVTRVYIKSEVDKVIAEKDAEIAELKAAAKETSVPNRTCRKCGSDGTLMYMPIVKDGRTYWDLYNNKGMDYVFGIQCAHCGEVAFVTKQTHEYELRKQKYKRCLDKAKWCFTKSNYHFVLARHGENGKENNRRSILYAKWHKRWLAIAEKFKQTQTAQ